VIRSFATFIVLSIAVGFVNSASVNTPAPAGTSRASIATPGIEQPAAMTTAQSGAAAVSKTPTPAIEQDAKAAVADSLQTAASHAAGKDFSARAEYPGPKPERPPHEFQNVPAVVAQVPGLASPVTTDPAAESSAVTSWPVAAPAAGIPCDYCHGTGTYTSASGWRGKCYTCQGTGVKQVVRPQAAVAAPVRYYVPASSCGPSGCGPAMQSSGYQWQRRPLLRWRR
jgi:hypothetical protein